MLLLQVPRLKNPRAAQDPWLERDWVEQSQDSALLRSDGSLSALSLWVKNHRLWGASLSMTSEDHWERWTWLPVLSICVKSAWADSAQDLETLCLGVMLQRHRLCLRAYEACQWPWSSQPIGTQEATGQRGVYSLLGPASLGLDLGTTREHYRKHPERMVSRHLRLALCSYENTQFWHMKIPLIFSTGLAIFRVQLTM